MGRHQSMRAQHAISKKAEEKGVKVETTRRNAAREKKQRATLLALQLAASAAQKNVVRAMRRLAAVQVLKDSAEARLRHAHRKLRQLVRLKPQAAHKYVVNGNNNIFAPSAQANKLNSARMAIHVAVANLGDKARSLAKAKHALKQAEERAALLTRRVRTQATADANEVQAEHDAAVEQRRKRIAAAVATVEAEAWQRNQALFGHLKPAVETKTTPLTVAQRSMVRRVASQAKAFVTNTNRRIEAARLKEAASVDLRVASQGAVAAAERQIQSSLQKAVDTAASRARFAAIEAAVQARHVARAQEHQTGDKVLEHLVMTRLQAHLKMVAAHPTNKTIQTAQRLLLRLKEVHASVVRDEHRTAVAMVRAHRSLIGALTAVAAAKTKLAMVTFPRIAKPKSRANGMYAATFVPPKGHVLVSRRPVQLSMDGKKDGPVFHQ